MRAAIRFWLPIILAGLLGIQQSGCARTYKSGDMIVHDAGPLVITGPRWHISGPSIDLGQRSSIDFVLDQAPHGWLCFSLRGLTLDEDDLTRARVLVRIRSERMGFDSRCQPLHEAGGGYSVGGMVYCGRSGGPVHVHLEVCEPTSKTRLLTAYLGDN